MPTVDPLLADAGRVRTNRTPVSPKSARWLISELVMVSRVLACATVDGKSEACESERIVYCDWAEAGRAAAVR